MGRRERKQKEKKEGQQEQLASKKTRGNLTRLEIELIGGDQYFNEENQYGQNSQVTYFPVEKVINFFLQIIDSSHISCKVLLNYSKGAETLQDCFAEFIPLDIKPQFDEILKQSISVLFTGGTMEPKGYLQVLATPLTSRLSLFDQQSRIELNKKWGLSSNHLSAMTIPKQVISKSFDHVVGPENIYLDFVSKYQDTVFKFTYENADNQKMIRALSQFIYDVFNSVIGGCIVFVPSYSFLDMIKREFRKMFSKESTLDSCVFFDDKENLNEQNNQKKTKNAQINIFAQFKDEIQKKNSSGKKSKALLFSVMGGTLSEGINFKDELARSIIVVGQPYPSMNDSSLKAQMDYFGSDEFSTACLNQNEESDGGTEDKKQLTRKKFTGQEYYESLCVKKVNQTIGRAIRHKNDWASIIMVDCRYSEKNWESKLPQWMMRGYRRTGSDGESVIKGLGLWITKME